MKSTKKTCMFHTYEEKDNPKYLPIKQVPYVCHDCGAVSLHWTCQVCTEGWTNGYDDGGPPESTCAWLKCECGGWSTFQDEWHNLPENVNRGPGERAPFSWEGKFGPGTLTDDYADFGEII